MPKKLMMILALSSLLTLMLAACGGTSGPVTNGVHMNDSNFIQSSITIKKGEDVTLAADTFSSHIIDNGTWANGVAKPAIESGAPQIKDLQVNGNSSIAVGPFNTAGTFNLYCTIHSGMNLTVIVQ